MRPRILLVGNYEPDGQQSMARYAQLLQRELPAYGFDVDLIRPEPVLLRRIAARGTAKKWLGYVDKYLLFPRRLRKAAQGFDLTHVCDHSNSMYLSAVAGKAAITCHDLLAVRSALGEFPQNATGWTGRRLQAWILDGLARARYVINVSAMTGRDLDRLAPNPDRAQFLVHHPVSWQHIFPDAELAREGKELGVAGERYFLHVGGNQWYKNRLGVLKIFSALRRTPAYADFRLLMAGKPWTQPMREYVEREGLGDAVRELCSISDVALQACYRFAEALIFPSLEEGFGWPVLEAQALGCPVVTSDRPPMTEVGGDAAIYIDPCNPESAAAAIESGLKNRERLVAAGKQNLESFDKARVLETYAKIYAEILRGDSGILSGRESLSRS